MTEEPKIELTAPERAILRTVLYSSLFDAPLTGKELQQYLMQVKLDEQEVMQAYQSSPLLQRVVDFREGHFFLRGRADLLESRRRRAERSRTIMDKNRWILKLISSIPCTRLVAISGSAAHLNIDQNGDIDLLVVTKGNRVWSVAVAILLLTKLTGCRKMVCFNFILSEQRLRIERHDLFNANQIISLRPLIGEDIHQQFVAVNPFVSAFYPNYQVNHRGLAYGPGRLLRILKTLAELLLVPGLGHVQEAVCRRAYGWYLKRQACSWKSPQEVVLERDYLKLHTDSHRRAIMESFEEAYRLAVEELAYPDHS